MVGEPQRWSRFDFVLFIYIASRICLSAVRYVTQYLFLHHALDFRYRDSSLALLKVYVLFLDAELIMSDDAA